MAVTDVAEVEAAASRFREDYERTRNEIRKAVVGHDEIVDGVLVCLFAGGHALLEGVPGLGKTLLIRSLSEALELDFSRIQFTPDLMPADITGTTIVVETEHGREFQFRRGPLFAQIVLADEINRATPKTQSALLEAMQERQVTAGGVRHPLPSPFFVLATQNPIEQEGTYPLPEAQLDRFMFMVTVTYPDEQQELEIVQRTTGGTMAEPSPVLTGDEVLALQRLVRSVPVADHVARYALRITRATRVREPSPKPTIVQQYVSWGAGPRASQFLVLAAKATALLAGDTHVTPEHVKAVALPVMRHRIICNFNAEADGVTPDDVIASLLETLPVESADDETSRQMDTVMK